MSRSLAFKLACVAPSERQITLLGMTRQQMTKQYWDWHFWAREQQIEPREPNDWSTWLIMAGRGFGKTRAGAEWIRQRVCGAKPGDPGTVRRIALVGTTAADVRDVMVKGPSGILAVHPPDFRPVYKSSQRLLEWPNGAMALLFSAEEPDQLRGPEHDCAWADETAKWRYAQETWDMLQFGLRIGENPRQLVTTTPRPIPIIRELLGREGKPLGTVVTRGRTFDNAMNLAPAFLARMRDRYEGTRLGRQELNAELLDDVPGALWVRRMFDTNGPQAPRGAGLGSNFKLPVMQRVVVGVDPSGSSGEDDSADSIGIVVAGWGIDGKFYVLEDATCELGPAGWARRVVDMYRRYEADRVVAERNYGGAMVEYTVRSVDRSVSYFDVTASRGKVVRAEPIAALYEQGKVRHVGSLAELEDQLCGFTHSGYVGEGSPDRADALVWALTELLGKHDDYDPDMWARLLKN